MIVTAKEYQPKSLRVLPHDVYMQVIYEVRGYARMKAEYDNLIDASPAPPDGMPRGTKISDPTADKAARLAELGYHIRAVEAGLSEIPEEYRKSVYNNIVYRIPYDTRYTSYRTYGYHKHRMIMRIARELRMNLRCGL